MLFDEVYDCLSICSVSVSNYDDNYVLHRLADIVDGNIVRPIIIDGEPRKFANRVSLYKKDGPDEEDFIGVWKWSALHNKSDYDKDYVISTYEPSVKLFEAIKLDEVHTPEDCIALLKKGITSEKSNNDILFFWQTDSAKFDAILCQNEKLDFTNGKIYIAQSTLTLPYYKVDTDEIIRFNNKMFYKHLNLNIVPISFYNVRSAVEVVAQIMLEKMNWQSLKSQGYSRDTYTRIRDYIANLDLVPIVEEVKTRLDCSDKRAREYVDTFMRNSNNYLDGKTISDAMLIDIIHRSDELLHKCEEQIRDTWEKNHSELLKKAEDELQVLNNTVSAKNDELIHLNESINIKKSELQELEAKNTELMSLGDEIVISVNAKIEEAKNNVSDFLANTIIGQNLFAGTVGTRQISRKDGIASRFIEGKESDSDPDIYVNWRDVVDTLEYELEEAGVDKTKTAGLAAIIYSCFVNKFPILLAGPNADDIAEAISITIDHHHSGKVLLHKKSSANIEIFGEQKCLQIVNPFDTGNINQLLNVIKTPEYFYMVTTPIAEDIKIEPQGLFNYLFPIMTELFVDSHPTGQYVGGKKGNGFEGYKVINTTDNINKEVLRRLRFSNYLSNQYGIILYNARKIYKKTDDLFDFKYAFYSLSFATNKESDLIETLNSMLRYKAYKNDLLNWLGVSNE